MGRANPYSELVDGLDAKGLGLLHDAVRERMLREGEGFGTLVEAAELYRPHPPCPRCGEESPWGDGRAPSGVRRWRCPSCDARFTSLAGTVLENCKKPLWVWVDFIRLTTFAVPLDAAAEMCGITHQTAWEWRHRLFRAVDGYQDRVVLRGRVWVDEAYVNDADLTKGYGGARKRGLSRQKVCIAVGIDERKEVVADVRDPAYLEAMELVNNLCSWLKRCLWRFTGMDPKYLQSYLNLYVYLFRVRRDDERWPKIARVVRHLLTTKARFRSST